MPQVIMVQTFLVADLVTTNLGENLHTAGAGATQCRTLEHLISLPLTCL